MKKICLVILAALIASTSFGAMATATEFPTGPGIVHIDKLDKAGWEYFDRSGTGKCLTGSEYYMEQLTASHHEGFPGPMVGTGLEKFLSNASSQKIPFAEGYKITEGIIVPQHDEREGQISIYLWDTSDSDKPRDCGWLVITKEFLTTMDGRGT